MEVSNGIPSSKKRSNILKQKSKCFNILRLQSY